MTLKLNKFEDLPLENPPAREVVCQVRFAPLLEISEQLPTKFQSSIRKNFPNFTISKNVGLESGQQLPSEYKFSSSNELSTVSLGLNFVALTTREYSSWTNFKELFNFVLETFSSSYGIILSSRIGLRFINEITLDSVGLETPEDLLSIINKDLRLLIVNNSWSIPRRVVYQISIPDKKNELTLRFQYSQEPEPSIIIDLDYFSVLDPPLEMSTEEIIAILEDYHLKNYYAFRWSIENNKIELFGPIQTR